MSQKMNPGAELQPPFADFMGMKITHLSRDKVTAATASLGIWASASTARVALATARHQSSGSCSAQPGLGVESG